MSAAINRKAWSPEEDDKVLQMLERGMDPKAISVALRRSPRSVRARITRLRSPQDPAPKVTSWRPYSVGLQIGGAEILAVELGRTRSTTRYRVRYLCCESEAETGHKQLADRQSHGVAHCVRCRGRALSEQMRRRAAGEDLEPATHPPATLVKIKDIDGRERAYPAYRAPMGHRLGA